MDAGFESPNDADIEEAYGSHYPLGIGAGVSVSPNALLRGNIRYWWKKKDVYEDVQHDWYVIKEKTGVSKLSQLNFELSAAYISPLANDIAVYVGAGAQISKTRGGFTPKGEGSWAEKADALTKYGPSVYIGVLFGSRGDGGFLEAGFTSIQNGPQDIGSVGARAGVFF